MPLNVTGGGRASCNHSIDFVYSSHFAWTVINAVFTRQPAAVQCCEQPSENRFKTSWICCPLNRLRPTTSISKNDCLDYFAVIV